MAVLSQRSAKQNATAIHDSRGDRIFSIFNYLFLTVILVLVLYPLIYVLSASFSEPAAVTAGEVVLWPVRPHSSVMKRFLNIRRLCRGSPIPSFMRLLAPPSTS